MKLSLGHRLFVFVQSLWTAAFVFGYNIPKGSPGFYHGNSTAAVTFDNHSLLLDGKRLFVFSGEVHPWRIPTGISGWRDVLQKMKAAGFNTVSVYHHWGLSEGKRGSLDFDYFRSHEDFYQVAKEVGVLVIARIGPYVNAETTGGGLPGWLTNEPARARTNDTRFTDAWSPWITAAAKFIEPYQYPDGPIVAVQCENEFWEAPGNNEYMQLLEDNLRHNGVIKVPLIHNDNSHAGTFVNGTGAIDLYTWDSYPQAFFCADPGAWKEVDDSWQDTEHQTFIPDVMWGSGEYQAGAFDPWGGYGYDECYLLTNEQFANVQYKNNYASKTTWINLYMTYGGTNWGNLAEPDDYTSYDYAAPIREDHTLSAKYSEIKLQANFLHASPDFLVADRIGNGSMNGGTAYSDNSRIYTTALRSDTGVNFYIVRQMSVDYLDSAEFKLRVNTTEGEILIPQFGNSKAVLDGRESQILVSEYPYGSYKIKYSTAEIFTWATIDGIDHIILYAQSDHPIEVVIVGPSPQLSMTYYASESSTIRADLSFDGTLVISGKPSGLSSVSFGRSKIFVADKQTALSFWNVKLLKDIAIHYDNSPEVPSILVFGPYLVRNATIGNFGTQLVLYGDVNATTTLEIVAPQSIRTVMWNDKKLVAYKTRLGTMRAQVPFDVKEISLPSLRDANWACADSLPEIEAGFDDSDWVSADKTETSRPFQPYGGKFILYADEYGFHQGNSVFRGHFTGKSATGVWLSMQGGFNFGYSTWINSRFLGSGQGTNSYFGGIGLINDTWNFDVEDLNDDDNILTVVLDPTGLEEDYDADDLFKSPRGVRGYELLGSGDIDFDYWKVQGNFGGEDAPDNVRGPLNEGGLFVERQGAHLPGFPNSYWETSTSSACTPYAGIGKAGISAYRTSFDLDLPTNVDIPVALMFERTPESSYRSVVYVNGWQFGRFNSKDGPQVLFPIPEGILNHRGKNELLVTLWSLDSQGAEIADLELVSTAYIASSREVVQGTVRSPTYDELRNPLRQAEEENRMPQNVLQITNYL